MTTCPTCHQTLSPSERANGTCAACGAQFPPVSLQTETELMGTLAGDVDPFAAGDTVAGPDAREVDEASHYDETALQTLASEPVPHTEQLTADYAGIDSDIDGDSRFDHSQTWKPPVADGLATVLEDEREPIPGTILQTPTPVKPKAAVPSTQPGGGSAGGKLEAALEEQLVIKERDIRDLSDDSQLRADFTRLKRIDQDESGRARGGMGAIWKARQTSLAREVALKMIKGETRTSGTPLSVSDDRSKDRPYQKRLRDQFLSEAHVTANLEHPYIVPIYDMARTSDNQLAYLMRFVRGADWADVIDSKTEEENLEILLKVADAVGYAHSKGVVHRDLKPSNIRVGDHGEVYVMDWGTAFVQPDFDTGIELTTGSNSLGWGTPAYAPPELFMGPLEAIGPASDVYLLGAMLFEIITGHPPHPLMNNRKAQLMSLCNNEIRQTDYKGELLDIALQAMKTKPAERFANVDEFIQRIRDYQKHAISRSLVQKAGTLLSRAQKSNDPQEFARAVITFQEAKEQWEHNTEAEAGASVARLAYAQAALAREDFDLGLSVADPQNPAHAEVVAGLKNGKATRQRRKRLLKMAYTAISVLLVTLVGGGVFSYQQIKAEKDYAVKQEGIATKQKEIATEQEGIAKAEKAKAEEQRDAAKVQSLIAELIGAQAQANEAVAIIKAAQAEQEQREALRQKESADKERTRADQKAELASRKQKEAEQQRQAAVASADRALAAQAAGNKEAYVAEIGAAAVKAESADSAGTRLSLDRIRNIDREQVEIEGTREQTRLKTGQELLAGELTAAQAELDELVQLQSVDTDNLKALQHEQQLLSQNSSQSQPSDRTPDVIKKLIDELLVKLKEDGALRQKADTEFATALKQLKALDDSMSQMSEIIATRRQANQEQISKLESSLKDRDQQIVKLKQKSLTLEKQIADAKSENQNGLAVAKYALTGGWEWRRLSYLADLPIKLFPKNDAPGARIPALHGLARSPQGDWIVTGTDEGDILTVSTTDGSTQVKNKVHGSPIAALAVSADGKLIASAGTKDRTIRLSHPASPQLVAEINVPTDVLSLDFSPAAMSPQRTWLLAACSDQMLRLWDLADATQPQSLPALRKEHDLKLTQAIFSPDGRQLVSVGEDRAVVWDLAAKAGAAPYERRQAVFGWHSGSTILAVDYTLQGTTRRIVTADNNGRIVVWNPDQLMSRADADKDLPRRVKENSPAERNQASARELQHHETNDSAPINFVTFSHDGRFVLSGSDDHTLQFQSVDAGSRGLPTTFRGHGRAVRGGTIVSREAPRPTEKASMGKLGETDPNHWFIVSVGEDGHAYRWNIGEYRENVRIETDPLPVEGDGPDRAILSTAFNSQGTSIIAGGADRIARIWDLRGQLEQEFSEKSSASLEQGHQLPIWTAAFSPRGDWFITAGMDGRSLIWDSHSQTQWAARLNGTGVPSLLAVSPDGRWIATATSQRAGQLAVWSVEKLRRSDNAEPVMFLGPHAKHATGLQLAALTFAPDIFDAATGKVRLYAAFFSNQESDSTGEQDLVWDLTVKDGSLEAHPLALPHLPGRYVTAAAFLAGGQELLTAATDGRILRIPVDQPGKSPTVSVEKGSVDFLHVLPDQKLLMVCRPTPKSIVLRKTRPDGTLESPSDELLLENVKEVLSASVSPAGDEAVLVCSAGLNSARKTSKSTLSEVRRFDVRNLKEVRPNNRPFLKQGQGEQARYWGAIFSTRKKAGPGNEILALHGTRAELVDAEGNTSARAEPQGPITAVSFSKSGKLALTAAVATIRIWDRETGADLKHITEPVSLSKVTRAVFSPTTEKWVLSAGYDGEKNYVRLWDVEKEGDQPAKTFSHKSRVHHIAFSADGEKFVSACEDGTVWIWDLNNDQQELTHWAAHDDGAALCAEFSNDGNWVISGGQNDKLAKVWKIENQQAQLWNKCEGHAGPVNSVAFSPISNPEDLVHTRVITGSNDTFVKVWDPRLNQPNNKSNAQELLTLKGHDRAVTVVAFSPDGSTVLSAGRDGRIMLRPSRK